MTYPARQRIARLLPALVTAGICMIASVSAQAQFKVIGADGKVTYTDREPTAAEGRVVPIGTKSVSTVPVDADLPYELRQPATKYPVTLYVSSNACEPCNNARQLLKQRGIPFSERIVVTAEDSEALEKLSGAREAPTLTIGSQTLRGLSTEVWNTYLDAAGYPRTSILPASYRYRAATPVVDRTAATAVARAPAPSAAPTPSAVPPQASGNIRF